jgi:hypothetical protein
VKPPPPRRAGGPASAGSKIAGARANLAEAGLGEFAEVRDGDARETLPLGQGTEYSVRF